MKNISTFTSRGIFIHTIVLGIVASFSHFAYNLSGKHLIVGLFNPVNESVWEHLKFMFFPFLLWWLVIYRIGSKKIDITLGAWIGSAAASLVAAPLSVILLFYSYTGALGFESIVIDILLVFVCYSIVLCIATHLLKKSRPSRWIVIVSVTAIAVMLFMFIGFTFNPPKLPIFYDTQTKMYGISSFSMLLDVRFSAESM